MTSTTARPGQPLQGTEEFLEEPGPCLARIATGVGPTHFRQ